MENEEDTLLPEEEKLEKDFKIYLEASKKTEDLKINAEVKSVESKKQFAITDFKAGKMEDGRIFIEGYANTKGKADRYGDVPTAFPALRNYVYELKEFQKNPVLLLDHNNATGNIAGSFNPKYGGYVTEDNVGLKFKAVFSDSDFAPVKHARTVYAEGHGRALSIGGKWYYEDKDNPNALTYAEIFEVSLVGVGADPNALTTKKIKEVVTDELGFSDTTNHQAVLAEDEKVGRVLSKATETKLRSATALLTEVLSMLDKEEEKSCPKKLSKKKWLLTMKTSRN